jgi:hypothetical protein
MMDDLKFALAGATNTYLARADVCGVGIGLKTVGGITSDELCVTFLVRRKMPARLLHSGQALPARIRLGGKVYLTDVEEALRPQAPMHNPPRAEPPPGAGVEYGAVLRGGMSAANQASQYGTLGCCLRSAGQVGGTPELFISCNHVLALYNQARLGDPILAPASHQTHGLPQMKIGVLAMYVPLRFGGLNYVDSAAGRIVAGNVGSQEIIGVGLLGATAPPHDIVPGQLVCMSGSASGKTAGRIVAVHSSVKIDYWQFGQLGRDTVFLDQIITSPMGALGDSGSILLDQQNRPLGQLFAGTVRHGYFNYMANTLALLG